MSSQVKAGGSAGFLGLIVAVATIGGFMFGYDSGAINGTQEGLQQTFQLDPAALGLTVSSLLPGCALGAFLAGRFADVFGRRKVLMAAAVLFILSAVASGAAVSALMLAIARFLAGAAVGAASVLSPAYISEVTPAAVRGRLASVQQVMIISGLTGAFVANYYLAQYAGSSLSELWGHAAWRWMFWVQTAPAILFLVTLTLIPESPRFLVARGHKQEALAVLTRLLGASDAAVKVREIAASLSHDHKPSLADIKGPNGKWRPIIWVGIGIAVFQQLVGINIVFYYGSVLWQSVGFTEGDSLKLNILSGGLSILVCLVAIAVIDKIGRRPMLLIGSAGMAVTLGVVTWAFAQGVLQGDHLVLPEGVGFKALVAANLYTIFFNFSWGPVMWVLLGEMFPNQMRGSALAVAGAAQWLANFAVSSSFPWLKSHIGLASTYSIYAVSAAISFFFVLAYVKETKGKELEAMEG
ncbi:MAG: sugar porter family MFS transporter [Sphingomonadales bacterium]|nr:sugar porter family MFS transporter [Sphingomonadales bacterium]MDE2169908.1 sugar porter family MFS transporter [Sphingomonadales bacterium]